MRKKTPSIPVIQEQQSEDEDSAGSAYRSVISRYVPTHIDDPYDNACHKLQLSAVPTTLPCREMEQQKISEYIRSGVKNFGSSSSLYISGMPGCGKTVCVMQQLDKLHSEKLAFQHKIINAMQLANPNLVYTIIYESIVGQRVNPASAALFLSGPEGGLSAAEEKAAVAAGFRPVTLGPRVLRSETAALTALALLA